MKKIYFLLFISFLLVQCKTQTTQEIKKTGLIADKAMVVSARQEAS